MAGWTQGLRRSAMQEMLVATARPGVLSLALGLPAPDLFPAAAIGRAIARCLADDPRALQYGPPSAELRAFVAALMKRRGVTCDPAQIFLTAGAQQGLSLLARILLEPGATVLLETHSYTGFHQVLAPHEARILTVPSSAETGIDLEAVEGLLASGAHPSLLYAIPDGHNPLGVSMPVAARRRLAGLASKHGFAIVEDDAYGLLTYDGEERPALRAFDADWVFHVGSFSKTLAPALRTGWVVVPERFVGPLEALKESSDIDTATLGQRTVGSFVGSEDFDGHVTRLRAEYARRRDALLAALERTFKGRARWSRPRAGFFVWIELEGGIDTERLLEVALAREHVAFIPGAAFAAPGAAPARSAMRLNFSYNAPEILEDAVARLARAFDALTSSRDDAPVSPRDVRTSG